MKLYHGSNVEINEVILAKCSPSKDFGQGFYTTVLEEQAWKRAINRVVRNHGQPIVTVFEVPDDLLNKPDLHIRVFDEKPCVEWAVFVRNNREKNFSDFASMECNRDNKYDIVVGPVANDDVGMSVRLFTRNLITEDDLKDHLDLGKLTNQYSFHTEKALFYLKKVGVLYDK
ncbi:MAG: DUF3990 domain-containing protein [Clostridia bacterium]|nr:DUF3990 domain-containing protein [Clostridia bacterium]